MPREKLNYDQRVYVVQRLAAFDRPRAIVQALHERFGVTIARQSLEYYDPTLVRGRKLHPHLKEMFETTRARAISEQARVSAMAARLGMLETEVQRALSNGNAALANRLRQLIDREMGDFAASRPTAPPEPTAALPTPEPQPALSDDERARALAALIDRLNAEAEWPDKDKTPE